ncbi:MAG: VWA domain-containing protein [Bacilli bacterium]|nr:VWA domain-containing protein [Bacilli bacterium]
MLKHRIKTFFKRGKLVNIISSSKKRLFITSLIILLISISIFMPKGILKKSYKKILAFAGVYTEEVKSVTLNGNYSTPGGFKIDKSAKWIGANKAEITLDLKTKVKSSSNHKKDIILIIDNSGSMNGEKLDQVKNDSRELVSSLLSDSNNRVSIISFNSMATLLSEFSNNSTDIINIIDGITTTGGTNYNSGLLQLDSLLSSYGERENTDLVALFLTDGCPGEDTPAEVGTYAILKDKYSYLEIVGIQYEMGSTLKDEIVRVSDRQLISTMDSLDNVLFNAALNPKTYENLIINDFINNSYFQVDTINDISTSNGEVNLESNKVSWNLSGLVTGSSETLNIVVSLKNGVSSDYYPLNSSLTSTSKIEDETEATSSTTDTPVLKDSYTVNYFANAPSGCSITNFTSENYKAYSNVTKKSDELSCNGYLFKGYEVDEDVNYINDQVFVMPNYDINIRGTWTKQGITKTMDGTIYEVPKLYNVLKEETENGGLARKYTENHHDSFTEEPSKDIYHWYAKNDSEGNQVLDKNNVIFAGQCWQMIRTTDTGGVKMIYNGEVENNQCLNTRETHVGYASSTIQNLASNYWYGTDYTYDSTNKTFKVSGTTEQTTWNDTTGPTLIGKYTCKNTSVDGTCTTLYLVESYYNTSNAYVIPLNSSSNYSQFGTLQFNPKSNSPAYVGYMYNTVYPHYTKTMISGETMLSRSSLRTTYWYGDSVTWGNPVANRYNLDNPYQVSATTDYPNLVGKYTFRNTDQTNTNSSVQYIAAVNNSTYYYIQLTNSGNHTLSDFNYTYIYGDSYIDNGDGTYTINNPTTIERKDWYTSYSNVKNKYVCKNAVNDTCSDLWYITETSNSAVNYIEVANNYKYAKGFTWDGSKYVLDNDTSISFWNINDSTNKTSINNAHYTCWNETGECTTISYIYYISETTPYYINISNGKSIEDAKHEMLYGDNVNTTNSTIKSGIDAWYKQYLLKNYDDYIEDTIYCNDRSQSSADVNGWNPNGGNTTTYMYFYGASGLSCTNDTDKFSVSNNKAKLTYKVGLMSYRDMNLLNNSNARKTGQSYWFVSPYYFDYGDADVWKVNTTGSIGGNSYVFSSMGVRPAISLKPGIKYLSGTGSMADPYVVDTSGD